MPRVSFTGEREGEEGEEKEKESAHDHTDKITMLGFTN